MNYFNLGSRDFSVDEICVILGKDFIEYLFGIDIIKEIEVIPPSCLSIVANCYANNLMSEYNYNKYCDFIKKYNKFITKSTKNFSDEISKLHACYLEITGHHYLENGFFKSFEESMKLKNALEIIINSHGDFEAEVYLQNIIYNSINWLNPDVYGIVKEMRIKNGRVDLGIFAKGKLFFNVELKKGKILKSDYYQAYEYAKGTGVKTILIGSKDSESIDGGMCDKNVYAYKTQYCYPIIDGKEQKYPFSIYFTALEDSCKEFEDFMDIVYGNECSIEIPYFSLAKINIKNNCNKVVNVIETTLHEEQYINKLIVASN